jgi:predicted HD superfamily hydrolase involved in NAD metabolism
MTVDGMTVDGITGVPDWKDLRNRVKRRVDRLPQGLQTHINRVTAIARELAPRHGLDPELAALAMQAHDVARAIPAPELLSLADSLNLPVDPVQLHVPLLLHGPVGAELLRREDGLNDDSLYQAVYWHTTGHPSLDRLGKLVFLADKLDPQKLPRYPYQPHLRELALNDLDAALVEFFAREMISLASRGELIHPAMLETRNGLLAAAVPEPNEPG